MKNFMAYGVEYGKPNRPANEKEWRISADYPLIDKYIKVQYENSIQLGWDPKDIILATNFHYRYKKLEALQIVKTPIFSRFLPKFETLIKLYSEGILPRICQSRVLIDKVWVHDLDTFQLVPFEFPLKVTRIGICKYPIRNRVNTGSMFYTKEALPTLQAFLRCWTAKEEGDGDEKALQALVDNPQYANDFVILNHTYNFNHLIGRNPFPKKYKTAQKPIRVVHFHPEDIGSWRLFCEGYGNRGKPVVSDRLRSMLIEHQFKRYDNPKIFLVRPKTSLDVKVDSFYLRRAIIRNKARTYITEQDGKPVFKIWRIWDKRLGQRLKDIFNNKKTMRLRITRKIFSPSSIIIEPINNH